MALEEALTSATYVLKDGEIVVKDGKVVNIGQHGRTYWVNSVYDAELETQIVGEVEKMFKKYYSVNFANYAVQDEYLPRSTPVKGVML